MHRCAPLPCIFREGGHSDVPLDLIESRAFGSRVIYERYGRARDESG